MNTCMTISIFLTLKNVLKSYLTIICHNVDYLEKSILSEKYISERERILVVSDRQLLVHNHYLYLLEFNKPKKFIKS